ncbi:HU domain-containing protein [Mucilaginibacter auburnensis]|uniref:CCDC81-like prokaryotic HU domain-containing protein n=1 Tax=Mucilaginibacter auburnensis TaxID=1457233 RepID=A0A2H9VUU7_9SPHI|nr:hypothetical protein [Mucilaginibacter auburnensis]PJJ84587.1 hypothetical protein CLV57_1601 [Mucilaginibacter auburnensis]
MDVGFYLSELLMQRGEVKVPGLGVFSQARMSAYYDENAHLFYPPYNKVQFEAKADTADTELAEYLVDEKNISFASAKYFIEKYIVNLRQQAIVADVPLANLGVFSIEHGELSFKANNALGTDAELFGLAPVQIFKADAIPDATKTLTAQVVLYPPAPNQEIEAQAPVEEQEEIIEHTDEDNSIQPPHDESYSAFPDDEEEQERSRGPWRAILITTIILAVLAGGLFALYRYQPATFAQLQFWKNNTPDTPVKARPSTIVIPGIDSLHTDSVKKALDTTAKVADTIKTKRFELISGKGFKNLWGAGEALKKYRAMGFTDARLLEDFQGPLIKISIASFSSLSECEEMRLRLIKEGKLTRGARTIEAPEE